MEAYTPYKFLDIFEEFLDGSLSPKMAIEISGIKFTPGMRFQKGVAFGGIDFHLYKYRNIAIADQKNEDGSLKIVGFYKE